MQFPVNTNITGLRPSATLAINEKSQALIDQGKQVIRLGFGQSPFPVPKSVTACLQENAHQKDYLPVKGLYALRAAVATYNHSKFGVNCTAEDVIIGPGSKELLFLTQLIYEGELLLPQPSWVSYAPQAQLTFKEHHWLPTKLDNNFMLDGEALEAHCSKEPDKNRILILNYPSNPTGSTLNKKQLKDIARVARKYKILILSDEIYGDVHHKGKHRSIAQYYPEGTIVSSGLSKWCGAGGWRIGTFVFPKELRWLLDQMAVVASETFTTTSAPIQYAAVRAYQGGKDIERYLKHSRKVLKTIAQRVHELLLAYHISNPAPKGGFYLMPDFSYYTKPLARKEIQTSTALCSRLLEETGVALLPLEAFGYVPQVLGARLSYVDFDGAKALELVADNATISAEILAPKVIAGIHKMGTWLKGENG